MRRNLFLLTALMFTFLITSCEKDKKPNTETGIETSNQIISVKNFKAFDELIDVEHGGPGGEPGSKQNTSISEFASQPSQGGGEPQMGPFKMKSAKGFRKIKLSGTENVNVVKEGTDWDIAVEGSLIIVNGGEAPTNTKANDKPEPNRTGDAKIGVFDGTIDNFKKSDIDNSKLLKDTAVKHAIDYKDIIPFTHDGGKMVYKPIAGKLLVVKLNGQSKYAVIQIKSMYKDMADLTFKGGPAEAKKLLETNGYYYTFDYKIVE